MMSAKLARRSRLTGGSPARVKPKIEYSPVFASPSVNVTLAGELTLEALGRSSRPARVRLLAAPQLLVVSYAVEGSHWPSLTEIGWGGAFALAYQAVIVAAFSYWIWYNLMRRYPVNLVMPFMLLQPLIGAAAGVVFRNEVITTPMIIGGIGILIGVAIIIIRRPAVIAPSTKTGI